MTIIQDRLSRARGKARTLPHDVRVLGKGAKLIYQSAPWLTVQILLLTVIAGLLPVAELWLTRRVVNTLTAGEHQAALIAAALFGLALLAGGSIQAILQNLAIRSEDRVAGRIDDELIHAGARYTDLTAVGRPDFHDRRQLLSNVTYTLPGLLGLADLGLSSIIAIIGIMGLLAAIHPLIPILFLLTGVVQAMVFASAENTLYRTVGGFSREGREMDYAFELPTTPANAAEIRVFGLGPFFRDRFSDRASIAINGAMKARLRALGASSAVTSLYVVVLAVSFWYITRRVAEGSLSPGDIALFIGAVIQAQGRYDGLSWVIGTAAMTVARLHTYFPFIEQAGPGVTVPNAGQEQTPPATPQQGITVDHVSFTYPETDREILSACSLDLPAGTVTALVGENGAGKSTLVKLLTRMYDPTSGSITLDGQPLSAYDLTALRTRFTVVYQDAARFAFSLADNIALADPAFSWTDPEPGRTKARQVGDRLGIGSIAAGLPLGYETGLTRQFDDSVELSGGQWQLVSFARGLMRDDAALAILDEPSSALDPLREAEQIDHLREFAQSRQRSVLLISHRLSTVRWVDQIAVMEDGRITEVGSHDALLTTNGSYAELFAMQASRYRDDA